LERLFSEPDEKGNTRMVRTANYTPTPRFGVT